MFSLIAASAFFLLIHFGVSGTRLRAFLVARMGAGPYQGVFALGSIIGILSMIHAYGRAPAVELWGQLLGLRPLAFPLVFLAFLLAGIGLATPSPTQAGRESKLSQGTDIARGIVRITRHPFLWGVGLWALVHLVVNSTLSSLLLFGSLLLLAGGGTPSIEAQLQHQYTSDCTPLPLATSNTPFSAAA